MARLSLLQRPLVIFTVRPPPPHHKPSHPSRQGSCKLDELKTEDKLKYEVKPKNEDDLKNEDKPKNEDDLKNEGKPKNEENLKMKMAQK